MTDALALAAALAASPLPAPQAPPVGPVAVVASPRAEGPGRFVVVWREPKKTRNRMWAERLRDSKVLEENADSLNKRFALPFDVPVVVEECGEPNSFYEKKRVRICYELYADVARRITPEVSPRRDAPDVALADIVHTLYHEVGHAFIDIFKLPTVGREEDAVDQFATLALLSRGSEGAIAAQIVALDYKLSARESSPIFWDEHSVDRQRAYDILCLVYGRNPTRYGSLLGRGSLPKERAETCREEYRHVDAAWDRLLAPYRKD